MKIVLVLTWPIMYALTIGAGVLAYLATTSMWWAIAATVVAAALMPTLEVKEGRS